MLMKHSWMDLSYVKNDSTLRGFKQSKYSDFWWRVKKIDAAENDFSNTPVGSSILTV